MPANDFLPFCPTDTGTNLLDQSTYLAATDRVDGNQPGVASSKLVNKAIRQPAYVVSQFAQFLSNNLNNDVLDNATPAQLLSQINATLMPIAPRITSLLSGTGTFSPSYYFFVASANATTGATYTNNSITYTVKSTISSGTVLNASGAGAPLVSGTLTKTGGTGDSTITFYAFRAPLSINVTAIGGGGGGYSTSSNTSGSSSGGNTTFGSSLIVAGGGAAGGLAGGTASLGAAVGIAIVGGIGGASVQVNNATGGDGAPTPFGGAGSGGVGGTGTGANGATNSGSGGGGGGATSGTTSGEGGSAGGYVNGSIFGPFTSYAYAIGASGVGATGGTNHGGAGGSGVLVIQEIYQ